ncbi:MAG TPA: RHS repeat-associated core domain-containing protein, partial [Blastocatellia bacterium]
LTRTTTDRRGNTKIEVFDPLSRLSSVTWGGQPYGSYQYDGNNNRTQVTDGLGNQTNYTYDPFNRVTQVVRGVTSQTPNGLQTETFGYDNNGNVTSHFDGVNTVNQTFDELNRMLTSTDGAGDTTAFQYDGRNLMTEKIEPNRNAQNNPTSITQYQYNELGSLTQVTDAAGGVWTYGYDAKQRLTSLTDALNNPKTIFGYDVMDRLQSVTRPLGMVTTYGYDANSNQNSMTDPLGHVRKTMYDAEDRPSTVSIVNADGSAAQGRNGYTFSFDAEANLYQVIENVLTGSTSTSRKYTRGYDARNRLTSATDGNSYTVSYNNSYDAANNPHSSTDAAGRTSNYTYDAMNRLSSMTTGSGRNIGYGYTANNLLNTVTYGNGMSRTYGYDAANRVMSIVNVLGADTEEFDYSYDANSNRTGEMRKFDGAVSRTLTYGYDVDNRLTQATYGGSSVMNYGYDPVGNRLTEQGIDPSGANVNKSYTYDALNRLSTMTDSVTAANSLTFGFDLNGNLQSETSAGGNQQQFTYDAMNQMLTASAGTSGGSLQQVGSYDYDFQGRRLSKTAGGGTLSYVYAGSSINVTNEFGSSGQSVNAYDFGTDLVSAQIGGEGERLYFHDALGSTTSLATSTGTNPGTTVARYEYDAWGKQISAPQPSLNRVNYTGYRHDDETDLEYAQARYYDSAFGRFDSCDPVTETGKRLRATQTLDYYAYADQNPLRYIDRTGTEWTYTQDSGGHTNYRWRKPGSPLEAGYEPVPEHWQDTIVSWTNSAGQALVGHMVEAVHPEKEDPLEAFHTIDGSDDTIKLYSNPGLMRTEGTLEQDTAANSTSAYGSQAAEPLDQMLPGFLAGSGKSIGNSVTFTGKAFVAGHPFGGGAFVIDPDKAAWVATPTFTASDEDERVGMVTTDILQIGVAGYGAFGAARAGFAALDIFEAEELTTIFANKVPTTFVNSAESLGFAGEASTITNPARLLGPAPEGIGPITNPARLLTTGTEDEIIAARYQNYYTEGARRAVWEFNSGRTTVPVGTNWKQIIGQRVDQIARNRLRAFLWQQQIPEGPGTNVLVNRWLRDPLGSGNYRVPDLMLPRSRLILEGTIGSKTAASPQIVDFSNFSGGFKIDIIRPSIPPFGGN